MTALLGSTLSRDGSIRRTEKQLRDPPILPPRADPTSLDAKILGPLSKRREVNLKWRFFKSETAKVYPPIEVSRVHVLKTSTSLDKVAKAEESTAENAMHPKAAPVGFQGTSVLRDLEDLASPNPNTQKRVIDPALPGPRCNPTSTVNHFIRRQHRKILAKIPILTYFKHPKSRIDKYQVSLSPLAHLGSSNGSTSAASMADEADLAWLRLPKKPNVDLKSTSPQEPKVEVIESEPDQNPPVHPPLHKRESNCMDDDDPPDQVQYRNLGHRT